MPKFKVLFIGLGRMGSHMAKFLSKDKNIDLYVYNRSNNVTKNWLKKFKSKEFIFNFTETKFDFVISCLKDDTAINNILLKKTIINNLKKNSFIIDHSTISVPMVIKINKFFSSKKIFFFDSPVTGGEEGAKNGQLSTMVGGNKTKYKNILKVVSNYCKNIIYMGASSNGQLSKYSNQILICGILISISEAIKFNKVNKINQGQFYNAVKNGAAGSWQLTNRFPTMIKNKFNFGFSTELMAKDLKYIISHSKKNNIDLTLTKKALKIYNKLSKSNYKKQDTSSIIKLI